jgi:tetraacyldisaccharide 4'-kinase
MGAEVAAERLLPDHHPFAAAELEAALRGARAGGCDLVVTTEKDAVRLPPALAAEPRLRAVRIDAEVVRGGEVLEAALDAALAARAGDAPAPAALSGRS